MQLRNIKDIDVSGKYVLLRSSLDTPVSNGSVENEFRIERSVRTINYLKEKKAKVVVISHLGRKGESLGLVSDILNKYVEHKFVVDNLSEHKKEMKEGEVILFENLRKDKREEQGSEEFAKELSEGMDLFVFDDFSVSHREHTSCVYIPKVLDTYFGVTFIEELENARKILSHKHPSIAILSGTKLETKVDFLNKLLDMYDSVFVGGVLANTLLALKGVNVGKSIKEEIEVPDEILNNPKLILPNVVYVKEGEKKVVDLTDNDVIFDVNTDLISEEIKKAEHVLWNGPIGLYEKGYIKGSVSVAENINSNSFSIVGGGNIVSLIMKEKLEDRFSFISTGGGSLFYFIVNESLPILEV